MLASGKAPVASIVKPLGRYSEVIESDFLFGKDTPIYSFSFDRWREWRQSWRQLVDAADAGCARDKGLLHSILTK